MWKWFALVGSVVGLGIVASVVVAGELTSASGPARNAWEATATLLGGLGTLAAAAFAAVAAFQAHRAADESAQSTRYARLAHAFENRPDLEIQLGREIGDPVGGQWTLYLRHDVNAVIAITDVTVVFNGPINQPDAHCEWLLDDTWDLRLDLDSSMPACQINTVLHGFEVTFTDERGHAIYWRISGTVTSTVFGTVNGGTRIGDRDLHGERPELSLSPPRIVV